VEFQHGEFDSGSTWISAMGIFQHSYMQLELRISKQLDGS
jgi:hypothetical protein